MCLFLNINVSFYLEFAILFYQIKEMTYLTNEIGFFCIKYFTEAVRFILYRQEPPQISFFRQKDPVHFLLSRPVFPSPIPLTA